MKQVGLILRTVRGILVFYYFEVPESSVQAVLDPNGIQIRF
jgi:hypothetical protein